MLKIKPLNIKNVVISGIIELLEAFRINPTQAHQILEEVKQYLPFGFASPSLLKQQDRAGSPSPNEQDKDSTRCSGKEVILTIVFEPWKLIDVQSQIKTFVSSTPIIQAGDDES